MNIGLVLMSVMGFVLGVVVGSLWMRSVYLYGHKFSKFKKVLFFFFLLLVVKIVVPFYYNVWYLLGALSVPIVFYRELLLEKIMLFFDAK